LRAAAAAVSAMLLNFLDEPNRKAKPALYVAGFFFES
jgi:hypothetical protein